MAVHKIKAKDDKKAVIPSTAKQSIKPKQPKKEKVAKKPSGKKPFVLFRPFVALGRYFRDSWRELRMVQWPTRKFTWKMTLSVIGFVVLFALLIMTLDLIFSLLFSNLIK